MIGGVAPSVYLPKIQERGQISAVELDDVLAGHSIPSVPLRADDFDTFFAERSDRLLNLIENATGKSIVRDAPEEADAAGEFEDSEFDSDAGE